jgi:hypothetical protein
MNGLGVVMLAFNGAKSPLNTKSSFVAKPPFVSQ